MKEKDIIQKLQDLHYTHAPKVLHKKIMLAVTHLPKKHNGFYFPLFAFRMGLAGLLTLLILGTGSGFVAASSKSIPGSPLYPLKKAFIKTQITFTRNPEEKKQLEREIEETPTPTQIPLATPTPLSHENKKEDNQEEHGDERMRAIKNVEGISDKQIQIDIHDFQDKKNKDDAHSEDRGKDH